MYHKGVALYNQGKLDEAVKVINESIGLNYHWADNWNEILINDTINMLNYAISANPNNTSAWINKGDALHKQGKYDDAIKAYDEAIRLDPKNTSVWFAKAHVFLGHGQIRNATEVYNEASNNIKDANVWIAEGLSLDSHCEEAIRCFDRAIKIYDESISHNSSNVTSWNNKGMAFIYQAKTDQDAYMGLSLYSDEASISKNLAHASYRKDKWEEALNCFDKATQLDPKCANAWYNKGYALWCLNDGYETIEYYEKAVNCFDMAQKLGDKVDGCLRVTDAMGEWAMRDKLDEMKMMNMTSHDVDRVAKYK